MHRVIILPTGFDDNTGRITPGTPVSGDVPETAKQEEIMNNIDNDVLNW